MGIEDLTFDEIEEVNGGLAPLAWAGIILAVHAVNYARIYSEL
ncbi:MAG: class IIb bacteriocin, lactobin A/cerein 7B family [Sphingobium sp.]